MGMVFPFGHAEFERRMKKTQLLAAFAAAAFLAPWAAQAGDSPDCATCVNSFPKTYSRAKKFKVCTKVIDRCSKTLTAQAPCGRVFEYTVSVITYQDIYSDGTCRTWQMTI